MNGSSASSGISKKERKEKERERRLQMKELCFNLSSLLPPSNSHSKDIMNQQDCLGETAMFISELKGRIEKLREIRDLKSTIRIRGTKRTANASQSNPTISRNAAAPVIEVRSGDTNLEVILVSNLHNRFRLHRVIDILNEEGADVKNANVSVVGDKVFYTIHSKDLSSRIGLEASRVLERLRDVVS